MLHQQEALPTLGQGLPSKTMSEPGQTPNWARRVMVGVTAHTTPAMQGLRRRPSTREAWSREELPLGGKRGGPWVQMQVQVGFGLHRPCLGTRPGHSVGQLSQDLGGESGPDRGTNFLSCSLALLLPSMTLSGMSHPTTASCLEKPLRSC